MKTKATTLLGLFNLSVCEHSWVNAGITLQGVAGKRCMKCKCVVYER